MSRPIPTRSSDGFRTYVRAVERMPLLNRKQELALARRYRNKGDAEAGRRLVEANLRYVPCIAAKYRGWGFLLADLVEEGNLGLLEAVRRFEPSRKLRVMTYASFWIRAYIRAFIVKHWSLVGIGSSSLHARMFFRLRGERTRLAQQRDVRESSELDGDLAELFGTTTKRIRSMSDRLGGSDVSLDGIVSAEGGLTLLDMMPDTRPDSEMQSASAETGAHVRREVAKAYGSLDARERLIMETRLMPADDGKSLAELGRQLGLTRERVRQLEVRLKSKLRTVLQPIVADRGPPRSSAA